MDGTRTVGDLIVERMDAGVSSMPRASPISSWPCTERLSRSRPHPDRRARRGPARRLIPGRKKLKRFGRRSRSNGRAPIGSSGSATGTCSTFFWWPVAAVSRPRRALVGLAAFVSVFVSGDFSLNRDPRPVEGAILLGLAFFLTFMHELGHSVVITHYGRR